MPSFYFQTPSSTFLFSAGILFHQRVKSKLPEGLHVWFPIILQCFRQVHWYVEGPYRSAHLASHRLLPGPTLPVLEVPDNSNRPGGKLHGSPQFNAMARLPRIYITYWLSWTKQLTVLVAVGTVFMGRKFFEGAWVSSGHIEDIAVRQEAAGKEVGMMRIIEGSWPISARRTAEAYKTILNCSEDNYTVSSVPFMLRSFLLLTPV